MGFFSKRTILKGEEITFDYKYERYGQHAQKCFCGSSNCRGWLGGEPDKENRKPEASDDEADDDEDADCWSSSSSSSSSESEADSTAVAAAAAANNQQVKVKHLPAQTLSSSSSSSPSVSPHPSAPIFAAAAPLVSASSAAGSTPVKIRRQIRRRVRKSPRKIKNFEDGEVTEMIRDTTADSSLEALFIHVRRPFSRFSATKRWSGSSRRASGPRATPWSCAG